MTSRSIFFYIAIGIILLAICLIAPFIGIQAILPGDIFSDPAKADLFWNLRVPRVLAAFIAGAGLAMCGMTFQALFRNPLADPFTLGIASGASCGAALMIVAGVGGGIMGLPIVSGGAFIGAAVSMIVVYGLSKLRKSSSNFTILLAGIAVSFIFSSLLMLLQYASNMYDSYHIIHWLMGGINVFGYESFVVLVPCVGLGTLLIIRKLSHLDQLLAGEDLAASRGVNIKRTTFALLAASTITVGGIVSICGPIGFVGLIIPHVCRLLFKSNHRILGPVCFVFGGTFLVFCDALARVVIAPAELPVGVITSLIGGPFFIWILFGGKRGKDSVYV